MNTRPGTRSAAFTLAIMLSATSAHAQASAAKILTLALQQQEARMRGVENFTLVHRVMGLQSTLYVEREMVAGRPRYRMRVVETEGHDPPATVIPEWVNAYDGFEEFIARARLLEPQTIDGRRVLVVAVDGLAASPADSTAGPPHEIEVRQPTRYIYIDEEDHVMRRMVMEGVAGVEGPGRPATVEISNDDFRMVGGMLYPFRTAVRTRGSAGATPPAELELLMQELTVLRTLMEAVPPERRPLTERMLRPMVDQLERMLAGKDFVVTVEVVDLRLNEGPPGAR
jgi:hypothetical protein